MVAPGLALLARFPGHLFAYYLIGTVASLATVQNINIILVVSDRTHCNLGITLNLKNPARNDEAASSVCLYTSQVACLGDRPPPPT